MTFDRFNIKILNHVKNAAQMPLKINYKSFNYHKIRIIKQFNFNYLNYTFR